MKFHLGLLLLLGLLLAGCGPATATTTASPPPEITPTATIPTLAVTSGAPEQPANVPVTLHIWLPPQFDPAAGTEAADLLQARLDEFAARRTGIRIDVRIKQVEGPGGILDTLSTASAAAPLALPDLVALPRHPLEVAAIKGQLHSYEGLSSTLEDPDWYEYARQLASLQDSSFGLPFAGDALMLVYRPAVVPSPPADWQTSLALTTTLAFPAADPQSLYTISLYRSTGAELLDETGRPSLDTIQLSQVFTYYQQAATSNLMPFWLTQYQSTAQSWQAFNEQQADLAVVWASQYLQQPPTDSNGAPLPTADGQAFTLATGWVWALASPDPERQVLSAQLAEFLTTSSFLAEWTAAAGYLPPRPSALTAWQNPPLQNLMNQIALSAELIPSQDIVTIIGPILQTATVDVLKEQSDPLLAAEAAAAELSNP